MYCFVFSADVCLSGQNQSTDLVSRWDKGVGYTQEENLTTRFSQNLQLCVEEVPIN